MTWRLFSGMKANKQGERNFPKRLRQRGRLESKRKESRASRDFWRKKPGECPGAFNTILVAIVIEEAGEAGRPDGAK